MLNLPRYLDVVDALQRQIRSMAPNSLLPTEHQLAKRFGVSRVTVRRALGLLERSGLVSRRRGQGTTVNAPKILRRLVPVSTFEEDLGDQGTKFETEVLDYQPSSPAPDHIRARLHLHPGETVAHLSMTRAVDDRIICYDQRYIAPRIASRFDAGLVREQPLGHILEVLAGAAITLVEWETEIVPASREVAGALGITPGVLVLMNTFTDYLADRVPVETGVMSYRVDRVKFAFGGPGNFLKYEGSARRNVRGGP